MFPVVNEIGIDRERPRFESQKMKKRKEKKERKKELGDFFPSF